MRHIATLVLVLCGAAAAAQEWIPVTEDAALRALLTEHDLVSETGASQQFLPSGRTLYRYGETSWGYWRVDQGRYCSQWPPSDDWDCYAVFSDGAAGVQFVDDWGNVSVGFFAE